MAIPRVRGSAIALMIALHLGATALGAGAEREKVHRVGVLSQQSPPPGGRNVRTLTALQQLGYVEGRNLVLETRWAEGRSERFSSLAAELVAVKPDVILADSTPAALAVKRATSTIPIVIVSVSDPVGSGLVTSLARPGGNITGVTDFGTELAAKEVDILHAVVPKATHVAVLMSDNPVHPFQLQAIQGAAKDIGLTLEPTRATSLDEFDAAFASMARRKAGAMILLGGAPFGTLRARDTLIALATGRKLPVMYPTRWYVDAGGLLSYGADPSNMWVLAIGYVAKILGGAKPGDLAIQQPSKFELVINRKTATALGLTIPPPLLLRADHIIE